MACTECLVGFDPYAASTSPRFLGWRDPPSAAAGVTTAGLIAVRVVKSAVLTSIGALGPDSFSAASTAVTRNVCLVPADKPAMVARGFALVASISRPSYTLYP